jgi:hypothetical protein
MTRLPEDVLLGSGPRRGKTIRGAVVDARQVVVANGTVKVKGRLFSDNAADLGRIMTRVLLRDLLLAPR